MNYINKRRRIKGRRIKRKPKRLNERIWEE